MPRQGRLAGCASAGFAAVRAQARQGKYVYVYKMTNLVNGRVYIGKTIRGYRQRWKEHKDELNRGKHCNSWLQEDWRVFGEQGFTSSCL